MRRSVPRASAIGLAAVFVIGSTTLMFGSHSWGGYHWARQSNPFVLKVGDNVSTQWDQHLDTAISDWSVSEVLDLTKVAGGTKSNNCRPTVGRIEVCNSTYGRTGWLGIAQIWVSGLHITQATTKLNDTYFKMAMYNKWEWRQLVMCQEIAHDFGLDHQDENFDNPNLGTCMDYTSNPLGPPPNVAPNLHDYEEIALIYEHLDSTTTISSGTLPSSTPPAMGDIDPAGPGQWGRLVRSSANGRVQTYELDFGSGHKILTHVFWADPEADGRGR